MNEGDFRFRFEPLPVLAEIAPSLGVDIDDANGDGHLDIVLAQNFYSVQPTSGQMDGGLGILLLGDGKGHFKSVDPMRSGIIEPGDAREYGLSTWIVTDATTWCSRSNGPLRALLNWSESNLEGETPSELAGTTKPSTGDQY